MQEATIIHIVAKEFFKSFAKQRKTRENCKKPEKIITYKWKFLQESRKTQEFAKSSPASAHRRKGRTAFLSGCSATRIKTALQRQDSHPDIQRKSAQNGEWTKKWGYGIINEFYYILQRHSECEKWKKVKRNNINIF